jgi:hypothetical protein
MLIFHVLLRQENVCLRVFPVAEITFPVSCINLLALFANDILEGRTSK